VSESLGWDLRLAVRHLDHLESMYGKHTRVSAVRALQDLELDPSRPAAVVTSSIVACASRDGKTSMALGAAANDVAVPHARRPVMFFSMEMGNLDLTKRLLAGEARVEAKLLWTGNIPEP